MTLHHARYDKQSKNIHIKIVGMKDEKVMEKWSYEVEVKGFKPSRVLNFHQDMGESLAHSITEQ
jgi:hypothetical protein